VNQLAAFHEVGDRTDELARRRRCAPYDMPLGNIGSLELQVHEPRGWLIGESMAPATGDALNARLHRREQHDIVRLSHAARLKEPRQEPRSDDAVIHRPRTRRTRRPSSREVTLIMTTFKFPIAPSSVRDATVLRVDRDDRGDAHLRPSGE
jgi:hypothetical protein